MVHREGRAADSATREGIERGDFGATATVYWRDASPALNRKTFKGDSDR